MRGFVGNRVKTIGLRILSRVTGRQAVLLPASARSEDAILDLRGPYRVESNRLVVHLLERSVGRLTATLLGYEGHFPRRQLWAGVVREYLGPCELTLDLASGVVTLAGREWGRVSLPLPGRRFSWRFALDVSDGSRRERLTGHYVPGDGRAPDKSYFHGRDYVDYEEESREGHAHIIELLKRHSARGPVLEVGCATGGLLAALDGIGLSCLGLDVSEWAVARACERLGVGRAVLCDLEQAPLPAVVKERSPFGVVVLASVLEHFQEPFAVLAKVSEMATPGGLLVITTTNADSLTHALFGPQWEGYFDWTHLGVESVGVRALRERLPELGWRVDEMFTRTIWDGSADPTRATLREWWAADARFRRLLLERDLGDLITCVAVKQ